MATCIVNDVSKVGTQINSRCCHRTSVVAIKTPDLQRFKIQYIKKVPVTHKKRGASVFITDNRDDFFWQDLHPSVGESDPHDSKMGIDRLVTQVSLAKEGGRQRQKADPDLNDTTDGRPRAARHKSK